MGHPVEAEGGTTAQSIATAFVRARLAAVSLAVYPGTIPGDLDAAYDCQDAAISRWPDRVAGWKVGRLPPVWRDRLGEPRLVGPIFAGSIWRDRPGEILEIPAFAGGFAAVEAEYVFRLGADAPAGKVDWTPEEAAILIGALHLGVEAAGSPLATINELGPCVVVSDFGNNAGLILGPAVGDWRERSDASLTCATYIDDVLVGRGGAASVEPLDALAFALARCARRRRPLKAGDLVSTGAATGIHDIRAGQQARIVFDGLTEIRCRAIAARRNDGTVAAAAR